MLDIFDVERIEVLRGPQGTLYGRNTIGGALKYVTRRLGHDFSARVRAAYGSYNQIDLVGAVTLPVGDTFSIGGAVAWLQRDGYGENLNTGNEHYNKDVLAARVSAEWEPTPDLFFRLSGDWIRDNSNARHGHREVGNAGLAVFAPPADVYDTNAGAGDENEVETRGVSLTRRISSQRRADPCARSPPIATARPTAISTSTTRPDRCSTSRPSTRTISSARSSSSSTRATASRAWPASIISTAMPRARSTPCSASPTSPSSPPARSTRAASPASPTSPASISDQWRLSLGARYTSDRREGTVYRQNFTGIRSPFFGNAAAVPGLVRTDYTNTRTDEQFTPRVSVSYLPTPDVTVYAAYSRGYKSGGFDMRGDAFLTPQTVNGYDPETVDAYEVGLKAYALQRALYVGIAAFYSDYRNQQVTTQVVAPGPSVASFVDNVGDSRISGVEIEARATVSPNISVAAMASYINADFKRFLTFDLATNQFIDVADQRVFQNTPQFTFMVAPTFTHGLGGGTISFTPSVSYRSDYSQFEIPNPILDEDGYTLVDAALVWTSANQRYQISLVGRNLTDSRYRIGGYNFPGALFGNSIIAFYGPPRTFTLSAEVRF